jgi:thioesterase domain-containing protein
MKDAALDRLVKIGVRLAADHGWLPAEAAPHQYELLMRVHAHNLAILADHQVSTSSVPTLLLVAGQVERPDPVPAWRDRCSSLDVEVWPHDHYSIVAPDRLLAIADRVTAWLDSLSPRPSS